MNFPDSPSNGDVYTAPSGENFIDRYSNTSLFFL